MGLGRLLHKIGGRNAKCAAVIVAAGNASRMKGTDKIMADLCGEPVLARTVRPFEACEEITQIVIVTREDLLEQVSRLCVEKHFSKVVKVVKGGDSREESVQLGMDWIGKGCGYVAIHDGARPLVTEKIIHDAIRKAVKFGAAAPGIPVKDTVKVVHGGAVESTPDRSSLYAVQTPQVFDLPLYRAALENAVSKKLPVTDDCSAAEQYGVTVIITEGSDENFKITTPSDLVMAQAILVRREEK